MPSGERFAEEGKARKISTSMLRPTKRELAGDFEQEGEKLDGQSEGMAQRPYPVTEPPTTSPIGATMPADHQGTRGVAAHRFGYWIIMGVDHHEPVPCFLLGLEQAVDGFGERIDASILVKGYRTTGSRASAAGRDIRRSRGLGSASGIE
jgi:hypothetical protein